MYIKKHKQKEYKNITEYTVQSVIVIFPYYLKNELQQITFTHNLKSFTIQILS